jgi:hypothetical protein
MELKNNSNQEKDKKKIQITIKRMRKLDVKAKS